MPSGIRLLAAAVGLALALWACSSSPPWPDQQALIADSVVVDVGVVNGVEWSVEAFRQDGRICSAVDVDGRQRHHLACSDLPPAQVNFRSSWFAGAVPLILFRLLEPEVAAVRLLVGDESVIVPTASLAPLGTNLRAVAMGFPAGARVDGLVFLAADGTELRRDLASIEVPDDGDEWVTFGDGDSTVKLGQHCRLGASTCHIQIGPDR
jgi:hypothetical protein